MNANTAVVQQNGEQAAAMVRSSSCIYVYWQLRERGLPLAVRIRDLSGRPASELLDGSGLRTLPVAMGQTGLYVENLPPGHLYAVEVGERTGAGGFRPLLALGPVQTPWLPSEREPAATPNQYHRS